MLLGRTRDVVGWWLMHIKSDRCGSKAWHLTTFVRAGVTCQDVMYTHTENPNRAHALGDQTRENVSALTTGRQTEEMLHNISSTRRSDRGIYIHVNSAHVPDRRKQEPKSETQAATTYDGTKVALRPSAACSQNSPEPPP